MGEQPEVDYEPHHALQRLIQVSPREIVIPFAPALADKADHRAVRMRRDFPAILGLTQAHALLHQHSRDIDDGGRVVADVSDYATVYSLVSDMVAEAAGATIPAVVRETVDTVRSLEHTPPGIPGFQPVTIQQVADKLGISRSSASRRLRRAESLSFVKDVQGQPGPKLFETYEPMPQDVGVLPDPAELT